MARATIYGIIARESNQVVLFRRGPSKQFLQLLWDLNTNEITAGQWLKAKLEVERCDVSPNGRFLVVAASDYSPKRARRSGEIVDKTYGFETWTAISRPPYFSALAIRLGPGHTGFGGMWTSNDKVAVYSHREFKEKVSNRGPFPFEAYDGDCLSHSLLRKRGWSPAPIPITGWGGPTPAECATAFQLYAKDPIAHDRVIEGLKKLARFAFARLDRLVWEKRFSGGTWLHGFRGQSRSLMLVADSGEVILDIDGRSSGSVWGDVDQHGKPIFAKEGCIYRWPTFPAGGPQLIADLNDYVFEALPPPDWALRW